MADDGKEFIFRCVQVLELTGLGLYLTILLLQGNSRLTIVSVILIMSLGVMGGLKMGSRTLFTDFRFSSTFL